MPARGMDVGEWVTTIILATVLVIVLAALMPTFLSGAQDFGNQTGPIGAVVYTLAPILVAVGILLLFVYSFLPSHRGHKGR